jgi:hypothetical protein
MESSLLLTEKLLGLVLGDNLGLHEILALFNPLMQTTLTLADSVRYRNIS